MRFLLFLADSVFRFRYRSPWGDGNPETWDIGIYEEEQDKMLRDFFIMGCVTAAIAILLLSVTGASAWLIAHH